MENNFQKLEEEMIKEYGTPPDEVKKKIDSTIGIFSIFATIIDLFITNMIKTIMSMTGSTDNNENGKG
jgi:hypothetical protein